MISRCLFELALLQLSQTSQGFDVGPSEHKRAFAIILAVEVFPLPLKPENKYACDNLFESRAKDNVCETVLWPTKSSNLWGLYFKANTLFSKISWLILCIS